MLINKLEDILDFKLPQAQLLSKTLWNKIINAADQQINILVNRKNKVVNYSTGRLNSELLAESKRRKSRKRLAGLRIIVITSGGQPVPKTELVLKYRLDNLVYIDSTTGEAEVIYPQVTEGEITGITCQKKDYQALMQGDYLATVKQLEAELSKKETVAVKAAAEKAILVGTEKESLRELARLTATAGVEVGAKIEFRAGNIDPAYYIGQGKLVEVREKLFTEQANVVIFDNELSPAQHSNLESSLEVKVIDRSQLILDIFARHANTKEGKLQVELAQLEYLLPRLTGRGSEMSRLGGGIGTRGPGETKLEIDRRRIRKRIHRLEQELEEVRQNRQIQRENRSHPVVSLVGYTNAGKSTIMNLLTEAEVEVKDKLFATLDSTLRQLELPIGRKVILSDTVGFIKKLPPHLVAAFKATLEEVQTADLLLHVVDSSHPNLEERISVVHEVLNDLEVLDKEIITIFNKTDLVNDNKVELLQQQYPNSLALSALTGAGREKLLDRISSFFAGEMVTEWFKIPYEDSKWLDKMYQEGKVQEKEYDQQGTKVKAVVPQKLADRLGDYQLDT